MSGFFPHIGGTNVAFTPLTMPAMGTGTGGILDSIVADVGAGVNGWTLFDDQRAPAGVVSVPVAVGGHTQAGTAGINITNGATALTGPTGSRFTNKWVAGTTQINVSAGSASFYAPTGAWAVVSAIGSDTAATLSAAWTNATQANSKNVVEQAYGYIVLKCTSTQKTFYVQIIRPVSFGDILRVQVWETWNAATHTGTNGSNQEILRAYSAGASFNSATTVQYILWLLPDAFALWAGANPGNLTGTNYWDLFYAGNLALSPSRSGDTNALVIACTNQELSGWNTNAQGQGSWTTDGRSGGVQILRNRTGGSTWAMLYQSAMYPYNTVQVIQPRGRSYLYDTWNPVLNDANQLELVDVDVYEPSFLSAGNNAEGRRGNMRNLKLPVGNPSGQHLAVFGPAEDGNTYVMVRSSLPFYRAQTAQSYDVDNNGTNIMTGFALAVRDIASGELTVYSTTSLALVHRFFLLPINL